MRIFMLFLSLMAFQSEASDLFTNHIKSLGFSDLAHYEKNKQYCFSLFNSQITSQQLNSQCGLDMQCLQKKRAS